MKPTYCLFFEILLVSGMQGIKTQMVSNESNNGNSLGNPIVLDLNSNLRLWIDASAKEVLYATLMVVTNQSISKLEFAKPGTNFIDTETQLCLDKSTYHSNATNSDNFQCHSYVAGVEVTNNSLPVHEFSKGEHDYLTYILSDTDAGRGAERESDYTVFVQTVDGLTDSSLILNGSGPCIDVHFQIAVLP